MFFISDVKVRLTMKLKKKTYEFEGQNIQYLTDLDTGHISLILLPKEKESIFECRREWLNIPEMVRIGMDKRAWEVGSLCHVSFDGYARGKGVGGNTEARTGN